jgi:hypothetical protein
VPSEFGGSSTKGGQFTRCVNGVADENAGYSIGLWAWTDQPSLGYASGYAVATVAKIVLAKIVLADIVPRDP